MTWTRFHPLTRITIVVAMVLIIAAASGWDRVGTALASFSPRGSFEVQCEALPGNDVSITVQPLRIVEDRSTPFASLGAMMMDMAPAHRTVGVTHAQFGHRSTVDVRGLQHHIAGRACAKPRVAVELFVDPIVVYIAREYAIDPCRSRAIREHEQRHVEVFSAFAGEAGVHLKAELAGALGSGAHYGSDIGTMQHNLERRIGATLNAFMRDAERTLAERQAAVDTAEEYARVTRACPAL